MKENDITKPRFRLLFVIISLILLGSIGIVALAHSRTEYPDATEVEYFFIQIFDDPTQNFSDLMQTPDFLNRLMTLHREFENEFPDYIEMFVQPLQIIDESPYTLPLEFVFGYLASNGEEHAANQAFSDLVLHPVIK